MKKAKCELMSKIIIARSIHGHFEVVSSDKLPQKTAKGTIETMATSNEVLMKKNIEKLKGKPMFSIQIFTWYIVNLAHVHVGNMSLRCSSHSLRTTVKCAELYYEKVKSRGGGLQPFTGDSKDKRAAAMLDDRTMQFPSFGK